MQKDFYIYPAISHYAEDGISISFPNLAGCLSCAQTDEEALLMAKDVLKGYLVVCEEDGDEIPHPTPLNKVVVSENERAVLIDVNMALYRKARANKAVKKTLTIPAWLNDTAEREGINFSFVLQNALKDQLNIPHE